MGAENSVLEGCSWEPHIDCPPKFPWVLSPVKKPDGTSVTVFEAKQAGTKDEDFLRKSASMLRGLRHPHIIRYIGSQESPTGFWLATEYILPLHAFMSELSSQELSAGLWDFLQGLDFLHSKLGVSHNNINTSSVYISPDGTWKLGGLELACKSMQVTKDYVEQCHSGQQFVPPEDKVKSGGHVRTAKLGHAQDVFAFGILAGNLLDSVKEKDGCAHSLETQLQLCLSPDPASRPLVSELLSLSVFRCSLTEILHFLRNITAKSDYEKQEFFCNLMPRLHSLSEVAVARRLVVPLLSRFVLLNEWAASHVLKHVLTPKGPNSKKPGCVQGLLSEHLFRQYVINHIYSMFHVYDSHIRLLLLEHFSLYVSMFTRQQLEDDIFIQVLLGVRDTDDCLVAASLRALADLVSLLGGDYVVGGTRKSFFFHGMPKISQVTECHTHNMMDILAENKPLLKNLAAASKQSFVEREKKVREREQRKEEARLRREERKHQLKEKQTYLDVSKTSQDGTSGHINQASGVNGTSGHIDQPGGVDIEDVLENNSDDAVDSSDLEKQAHDWSDWEDADHPISDEKEIALERVTNSFTLVNMRADTDTLATTYISQPTLPAPVVQGSWTEAANNGAPVFTRKSQLPTKVKDVETAATGPDLSACLDIKTSGHVELDYFADMAPSITGSRSGNLLPGKTLEEQTRVNSAASMFDMPALSQEEVKGWGDDADLDWKVEEEEEEAEEEEDTLHL